MDKPTRVIDAHLHFEPNLKHFDALARDNGGENSEAFIAAQFAANNIERGIVMGNRELTAEAHVYPAMFRYCAGIHGKSLIKENECASLAGAEAQLRRESCVGLKVYAGYVPHPINHCAFAPYYELAAAYHKPVAVHMGVTASPMALLKNCHPIELDEIATQNPNVNFIMCHFGNPWLTDAAAVIEKNDNVFCDLSGLIVGRFDLAEYSKRLSGYVEHLKTWIAYVEDYGKFMFGTDWPLVDHGEYIAFIASLIPRTHWDDVFYLNAKRIYGV